MKEFTVHPWNARRKAWVIRTRAGSQVGTIKGSKVAAQKEADDLNRRLAREQAHQ